MATPVIMLASSEQRKHGGVADVLGRRESADRDRREELGAHLRRVLAHEGFQQRRLAGDRVDGVDADAERAPVPPPSTWSP